MTTFTKKEKYSDAGPTFKSKKLNPKSVNELSVLTLEIAEALIEAKAIQEGRIQPGCLKDI